MKRLEINLASRPFKNLRSYYTVFGTVFLILFGITTVNLWMYLSSGTELSQTNKQIASVKKEIRRMKKEMKGDKRKLQNMNLTHLNREITFVNGLLRERYFSWTRLLNRLEDKIPRSVMLKSISPNVEKDQIRLTLECVSRNPSAVVDFIKNLEESKYYKRVFPGFEKEETGETFGKGVGFNIDMIYEYSFEKEKKEDVQKKSYIRTPI